MGVLRSVLVFVLVVALSVTLVAGNAAVVADRTVMNEGFVTTTLEEERAYTTVQSIVGDEAEQRVADLEDIPVPIDPQRAVNETLTRAYLKNETEANVGRIYGYLRGDRSDLRLWVNLTPVKRNVGELAERRISELSVSELLTIVTEGRDLSVTVQNVTFDLRVVANMSQGPDEYEQAREDFRADVRQVVVNQLVEEAFQGASDDELLLLVGEDPRQYNESETDALITEREDEIKDQLESQIREQSGDEIDAAVEDQLGTFSEAIEENVARTVNDSLADQYQPVAEPATEMLMVGVEGLTTNMSYETFDERLSSAKADLSANVSTVVVGLLDEQFDDRQVLFPDPNSAQYPEPTADQQELLDTGRQTYSTVSLLSLLLPLLALGLVGLLYVVTRSVGKTAFGAGFAFLSVGGSWFAMATFAPGVLEDMVNSELAGSGVPERAIDLVLGIFGQVFGAIAAQSLVIALLGLVGLGVWLALKLELVGGESKQANSES